MASAINSKNKRKNKKKSNNKIKETSNSNSQSEVASPSLTPNEELISDQPLTDNTCAAAPITNMSMSNQKPLTSSCDSTPPTAAYAATSAAVAAAAQKYIAENISKFSANNTASTNSDARIVNQSATPVSIGAPSTTAFNSTGVSTAPAAPAVSAAPAVAAAAAAAAATAAAAVAANPVSGDASKLSGPKSNAPTTSITKEGIKSAATAVLTDAVKYSIKSVIASRSIDVNGIVKQVVADAKNGKYNDKLHSAPKATTAPAKATSSSAPKVPTKDASIGVGAALAGAGAAISSAVKSKRLSVITDKSKLNEFGENVKHCIESVIKSPSIDVYSIINPSNKQIKQPEAAAAAGNSATQMPMPSSKMAPDTPTVAAGTTPPAPPKKSKTPDARKAKEFLKKNNCIIA